MSQPQQKLLEFMLRGAAIGMIVGILIPITGAKLGMGKMELAIVMTTFGFICGAIIALVRK